MKLDVTQLINAIDNPRADEIIGELNEQIGDAIGYGEVMAWYFVDEKQAKELEASGEIIVRYFDYPLYGER